MSTTYAAGLLTIIDIAKSMGGAQPAMVDALTSENAGATFRLLPMRQIEGWIERFTRKTGRPTVSWRRLGEYVAKSKGKREPWSEGVFLLSGYSECDKIKADRDPRGPRTYRAEQDTDYLESLGYNLSDGLFYGSASQNDGPDGLMKRLPVTGAGSDCTINAGATSETTSIYAIKFGANRFMGIYNLGPSGQMIEAVDYGAIVDKDSSGNANEIYQMFFNAAIGFAQYHPKAIGRIAKMNSSNKCTNQDFTDLFAAMGWKPDIFITTWTGAGYINDLKVSSLTIGPSEKRYDTEVDNYRGVPIIVDPALSDVESGKSL